MNQNEERQFFHNRIIQSFEKFERQYDKAFEKYLFSKRTNRDLDTFSLKMVDLIADVKQGCAEPILKIVGEESAKEFFIKILLDKKVETKKQNNKK